MMIPKGPPWDQLRNFHPKAHTLRTSSLVKEPRFFNAVDIASKGGEAKTPGVHQPTDSWGGCFCFLIWNNIVSRIFSRCSWKMCTKILGCRSTNSSEFPCACRFFVVLLTAWWYQRTLIKERNIKDTQNWKQAHDLVTSTLPNLSPDLTPPYLQVHQTAVVDVVSLKGFPNALLPADARASQNLLEGNRSTSVKRQETRKKPPSHTYDHLCMDPPPLQGFNAFAENFNFGGMIRHWKWNMWGCCINHLYHFDHWHFESPKEHAWKSTLLFVDSNTNLGFGSFFSSLHEGFSGEQNGCSQISGISSPHPKASKIRKSDLVPKAIKTLD